VLSKTENACVVVVGNKSDLNDRKGGDEPELWCKEKKLEYFETSVKLNINVNEVFEYLVNRIYEKRVAITKPMNIQLG
jgi:GTPase SAR1 family protein